jgi:hypothetical protein
MTVTLASAGYREADANACTRAHELVKLRDASWVVFTVPVRFWGLGLPVRIALGLALLIIRLLPPRRSRRGN